MTTTTVDETALQAFVMKAVDDLAAGYLGVMVSLGSRLGLYRALAESGPLTSAELAARTDCAERYVRDWASAQAARHWWPPSFRCRAISSRRSSDCSSSPSPVRTCAICS